MLGIHIYKLKRNFKMAERIKKQNSKGSESEWSRTGTFLHKPQRGWIHSDEELSAGVGVCYGVRYLGCIDVKESMKVLDFESRTALAREAISRVSEATGMKTASKRKKVEKRISKMLGEFPIIRYAGVKTNLTITVDSISLIIMQSGQAIANHLMATISFASGGDAENLDFVAYVAKDEVVGRACHVLECSEGLSEDVISTIGQAFELRLKDFLKKQPKPVHIPHRLEHSFQEGDSWGGEKEENEYYNDNPSAWPISQLHRIPSAYSFLPSHLPITNVGITRMNKQNKEYDVVKKQGVIDIMDGSGDRDAYPNSDNQEAQIDLPDCGVDRPDVGGPGIGKPGAYNNHLSNSAIMQPCTEQMELLYIKSVHSPLPNGNTCTEPKQADVGVPTNAHLLPNYGEPTKDFSLMFAEWYHGNLTRKQAEILLQSDGDFLVRQSSADSNQYVLSGRQNGACKHLLLVDPAGVVRTKDHSFESVPHLINFHRKQNIPIVSEESVLHLKQPISNKITVC